MLKSNWRHQRVRPSARTVRLIFNRSFGDATDTHRNANTSPPSRHGQNIPGHHEVQANEPGENGRAIRSREKQSGGECRLSVFIKKKKTRYIHYTVYLVDERRRHVQLSCGFTDVRRSYPTGAHGLGYISDRRYPSAAETCALITFGQGATLWRAVTADISLIIGNLAVHADYTNFITRSPVPPRQCCQRFRTKCHFAACTTCLYTSIVGRFNRKSTVSENVQHQMSVRFAVRLLSELT